MCSRCRERNRGTASASKRSPIYVQILFRILNRGLLRAAHKREERERGSEFFEGGRSGGRQSDELSSVRREEIIELIADNLGRPTKYSKVNNANAGGLERRKGCRGTGSGCATAAIIGKKSFSSFPATRLPPSLPLSLSPSLSLSLSPSTLQTEICEAARAPPVEKLGRLIGQSPNLP